MDFFGIFQRLPPPPDLSAHHYMPVLKTLQPLSKASTSGGVQSPGPEVYRWLGLQAPWLGDPRWQCAESGQVFFDK